MLADNHLGSASFRSHLELPHDDPLHSLMSKSHPVEVLQLLSVDGMVRVGDLAGHVEGELGDPDGKLELLPEELNVSLYPGNQPRLNARSYRNPIILKSKGLLGHIHQL